MSFDTYVSTTSAMIRSYISSASTGYTDLIYHGWPILIGILVLGFIFYLGKKLLTF